MSPSLGVVLGGERLGGEVGGVERLGADHPGHDLGELCRRCVSLPEGEVLDLVAAKADAVEEYEGPVAHALRVEEAPGVQVRRRVADSHGAEGKGAVRHLDGFARVHPPGPVDGHDVLLVARAESVEHGNPLSVRLGRHEVLPPACHPRQRRGVECDGRGPHEAGPAGAAPELGDEVPGIVGARLGGHPLMDVFYFFFSLR